MKPTQEELALAGVIIYHTASGFRVDKYNTPRFPFVIDGIYEQTFDEALKAAEKMWKQAHDHKPSRRWSAIMRYNRGLGIEMKELDAVDARTEEEARQKAEASAELLIVTDERFHGAKVIHIKVRPLTMV